MYLLGIGIVLLLLKYLEIGPVAVWSWWVVLVAVRPGRGLVDLGRHVGIHQEEGR
jgi:hypothetical protein